MCSLQYPVIYLCANLTKPDFPPIVIFSPELLLPMMMVMHVMMRMIMMTGVTDEHQVSGDDFDTKMHDQRTHLNNYFLNVFTKVAVTE